MNVMHGRFGLWNCGKVNIFNEFLQTLYLFLERIITEKFTIKRQEIRTTNANSRRTR